jgi:hypothetical protein
MATMRVGQARDAARQWVIQEASGIPGFWGAYTAGSTNWLPDDAELTATSDFDVMVVLTDPNQASRRCKFRYRDVLLEASYLNADQLRSSDLILSDYHLAPSFRTTNILLDPSGHLTALRAIVRRDYAKRQWVRQRCANAKDRALGHLRSINEGARLHDLVIAYLFAAGIMTHVLLVAGLRNPTVRARYVAVRQLLAEYGQLEFHETILEMLGTARMSRGRVDLHLATLTDIFDAAKKAIKTPFPFASDLSDIARPIAIDGSLELIERGYHREAMFWIAVTHSRCLQVLSGDTSMELPQSFHDSYRHLVGDLGIASFAEVRRRCAEVEGLLQQVWEVAERIMAANWRIEND